MKTRTLLNISKEQYNTIVFNLFMEWVANHPCSPEVLQLRLINKSLQNYFKHQLNIVETEFKRDLKDCQVNDLNTIKYYYTLVVSNMKNNYPSALLKNIKPPKSKHYDPRAN